MTDIVDSLKARLYDFRTSPFLATFFFSWMFVNYKLVLVFFSGDITTLHKINKLTEYWEHVNYILPLYIALGYLLVFPLLNIIFYGIKLIFNALYNLVQQEIEDITPMPMEKVEELKEKYNKLFKEQEQVFNELEEYKNKYMSMSNKVEKHINEEVHKKTEWFDSEKNALESQLESMKTSLHTFKLEAASKEKNLQKILTDRETMIETIKEDMENRFNFLEDKHNTIIQEKDSEITGLNGEIKLLKDKLDSLNSEYANLRKEYDKKIKTEEDMQNIPKEYLAQYTTDELKILEHIYRNDIVAYKTDTQWHQIVKDILNLPIIEVEKIFKKLRTNKNLFEFSLGSGQQIHYKINDKGKEQLSDMFNSRTTAKVPYISK